ncbi:hypothetical protein OG884_19230 [Streptosporangium sp. NBC_01755]|uniref:hypothetical protein n=1 Tax=unclassified Streptosporangium TaxID=2632669 RepID=UPI002DD8ABB3|nr:MULTISPECIES: hypothetical protein [unclassified Streptosporangium]WSA24875.1 hypothetical protein OIE13_28660 [Streptosporangium sp. NBC_01810]WSD03941.1 hypothetical protein OG884_19230 [Streptosporangium sp. NBC_01755]
MSRQTAFTLMLLLVFSVIVPGSAGYLSVKMEAIGQAHQELLTLENRIRHEKLAARIKRMERVHRARRLQPVAPSGREPAEPVRSSRVELGTPPLERRGGVPQYRERLTGSGSVSTAPDSIGGGPREGTGESLEEGLLPQLSQTETRAN